MLESEVLSLKLHYRIVAIMVFNVIILAFLMKKPISVFAWGDNTEGGKGRPSYTIEQINQGVLGDKIVFNSISDGVIGDEKNFVGARENTGINVGPDNVWYGNDINVENGKEYLIRLYIHNNSPKGMDAVAEDVHIAFSLPHESAKDLQVNGFIRSSNATPTEYWDYVNFHSDVAFRLEYIGGSGLLESNGIGSKKGGYQLSDDIVKAASGGIMIGYDSLNGQIPGCFQYDACACIRVKVVYDYSFEAEAKVRLVGDTDWLDTVSANVGDKIETQISYHNTGDIEQNDVMIRDLLPSNLRYIPESAKLERSEKSSDSTVDLSTLTTSPVNIGSYAPNESARVTFTSELISNDLPDGENFLASWSQVSIGPKMLQDYTTIEILWDKKILVKLIVTSLLMIFFLANTVRLFIKIIKQKHQHKAI